MVLVAPLDWGLGHATRCIPIINQFLLADCEVIIAAEGKQRQLLAQEFPSVLMLDLAGYRLKYGKSKEQTLMKIILQVPKILIRINHERKWLADIHKEKHLNIVVADNRYGLHHPQLLSVFITHQLTIKSSMGKWIDRQLQKINYRFIRRFNHCWVPDAAGNENLGGELSHPASLPLAGTTYLGALSRIKEHRKRAVTSWESGAGIQEPGDKRQELRDSNWEEVQASAFGSSALRVLVLLSGPEPQRSIFEKKICEQLHHIQQPAVLVRGLAQTPGPRASSLLQVYDHLPAAQLQPIIHEADIIISRSGYSTIMDLLPLGKKCLFIPTPGQPEQEYLAAYLAAKSWCCTAAQDNFLLGPLIEQVKRLRLPDLSLLHDSRLLEQAVKQLLAQSPALG